MTQELLLLVGILGAAVMLGLWLMRWMRRYWQVDETDSRTVHIGGAYSPVLTWLKYRRLPLVKPRPEVQPKLPSSFPKIKPTALEAQWTLGLGLLTIMLALTGQFYFSFVRMDLFSGIVLFGMAVGLFLILERRSDTKFKPEAGLYPSQNPLPDGPTEPALINQWRRTLYRINTQPLRVVLAVISVALAYITARLLIGKPENISYLGILFVWLVSVFCVVAAFANFSRPDPGRWLYRRPELLTIAILTLAGGALRFWAIGSMPEIISGDEGRIGLLAKAALEGKIANMFATTFGHGTAYLFMMAGFLKVFGVNPLGLRLTSALAGTLSIPAVYVLARRIFNFRVAFVAAGLLAVSHFHLHFSRIIASGNIQDALFAPLVFYFFWTGLEEKNVNRFIASALLLGLHLYIYMGARLIVLLLPVYTSFLLVIDRKLIQRNFGNLLVFCSTFIVFCAPFAVWIYQHPEEFMVRVNQMGIIQSGWLAEEAARQGRSQIYIVGKQLWHAVLTVNYFPATAFYRSKLPMLDFAAGAAYVLGLAYSLRHVFERRHLLLQGWFWSAMLGGGALLVSTGDSAYRIMILFPVVCIFVALGVDRLLDYSFKNAVSRRIQMVALIAVFTGATSILNVKAYFVDYLPTCAYEDWGTRFASKMAAYLGELEPKYAPYLLGAPRIYYGIHPSVDFLSKGIPIININQPLTSQPAFLSPRDPAVFFLIPDREQELDLIKQYMPGGEESLLTDCRQPQMLIYKYEGR